jgi:hypothetical protein
MNHKYIWIVGLLIIMTSCASWVESDSQTEWIAAVRSYKKTCKDYYSQLPAHKVRYTEEEKNMSMQDFLAKRCNEDHFICNPPLKPANLVRLEKEWRKPVSPEACLFKEEDL